MGIILHKFKKQQQKKETIYLPENTQQFTKLRITL